MTEKEKLQTVNETVMREAATKFTSDNAAIIIVIGIQKNGDMNIVSRFNLQENILLSKRLTNVVHDIGRFFKSRWN